MDFSTSSLCVKWKKTASRCWCSRIFLLDLQPRCWNLHTAFQLIWDYPLLAPALVSAPATRTSLDANLFKNWNLGGDWNIWFFTQPIIAPVLFFQQTFHLARSNSPEHLLLLILLKTLQCWRFCSLLFFSRMSSSTLQPFSALQCKRSRMEDGWLKDGISFWLEAVFAVFPWLRLPTFRSFW